MKKNFILLCMFIMGAGVVNAQDCMDFFPTDEGASFVTKTYDASNTLISTMNYKVKSITDAPSMDYMEVDYTMTDGNNNVISNGNIDASCGDENFSLKLVTKGASPEFVEAMKTNTELIGYFLNYPDVFRDEFPYDNGPFDMDGGEYTIEDKSDRKKDIHVRVYNRQIDGMERVITPARHDSFNAYKIKFNFDVTSDGRTEKMKGIQWYSPSHGIVKSEAYDSNNNLVTRTELDSMSTLM